MIRDFIGWLFDPTTILVAVVFVVGGIAFIHTCLMPGPDDKEQ